MEEAFKRISPEEFDELDFSEYTLLDLREPGEIMGNEVEGAFRLPISEIGTRLSEVPKDKPVIVFCKVGAWSEPIAEVLADRGYDVTNLDHGFNAYLAYLEGY